MQRKDTGSQRIFRRVFVGLIALLILLVIFVNRNLASLVEYLIPGSALWVHLVLLLVEGACLLWFWGGLFRRGERLTIPAAEDTEGRARFASEFSRRMRNNHYLKPLIQRHAARSDISASDIIEGKNIEALNLAGVLQDVHRDSGLANGTPENITHILHHGLNPEAEDFFPQGLDYLDYLANEEIQRAARRIFVSTALSQNGRLDAIIVFASLCRLVWRVSAIYNQRPHPREISSLYWAVVSSTFIALSLEELDLSSEISISFGESFQAVAPAAGAASLPFVGSALQIFTSSVADGAANCYLALRAGIITRNAYSYNAQGQPKPSRSAVFKEAGGMLLDLSQSVVENLTAALTGRLFAVSGYACNKTIQVGRGIVGGISGGITKTGESVGRAGKSLGQTGSKAGESVVRTGKKGVRSAKAAAHSTVSTTGRILGGIVKKPLKIFKK